MGTAEGWHWVTEITYDDARPEGEGTWEPFSGGVFEQGGYHEENDDGRPVFVRAHRYTLWRRWMPIGGQGVVEGGMLAEVAPRAGAGGQPS